MNRILATAASEFRIAFRNRWVSIATGMMVLFALVLAAAGSAPTGDVGVDRLSVTIASLTSLAVYLVPLLALLMSFDAVAGEVERGTLPLLLTYPVSRLQILLGKLIAHSAILALAVTLGYGAAALVAVLADPNAVQGLGSLWRLIWTSVLLGATSSVRAMRCRRWRAVHRERRGSPSRSGWSRLCSTIWRCWR